MNERKNAARYILITVLVFLFVCLLPNGMGSNSSLYTFFQPSESSVEIWVDRGCGGHYRAGESLTILFRVASSAPKAVVIVCVRTPEEEIQYYVHGNPYTTNAVHSLTVIADCPPGIRGLEIQVASPPAYLSPEKAAEYEPNTDLSDTCYFYIDPPCVSVDNDNDGYSPPSDCDDDNPLVHPEAAEVCDGKDNDCDGAVDEGCYTCPIDRDGDSVMECDDCNDNDRTVYPGAVEVCDGKDNDCDGAVDEGCCVCYDDKDGDGYSDCWDCNDNDNTVYPGAKELCDGIDNDCDGETDEGASCHYVTIWIDKECGGYYNDGERVEIYFEIRSSAPTAVVTITGYPPQGAPEVLVSEKTVPTNEVQVVYKTAICPIGLETLVITAEVTIKGKKLVLTDECSFYVVDCRSPDMDNDGYDSTSSRGNDCDDTDPDVHPGAAEVCDGKDNNCNGFIDEGIDCNYVELWVEKGCGSYFNEGEEITIYFQVRSSAFAATITLVNYPPQGAPVFLIPERTITTNKEYHITETVRCPAGLSTLIMSAEVIINGEPLILTADCTFYVTKCRKPDNDEDGYDSLLVGGEDCNDDDPDTNPGAEEICDREDNDCDGEIDEGFDSDADGYTFCGGDCNDSDPGINPEAEEVCDGVDNNCNGFIDEGFADNDNDGHSDCVDCNDNDPAVYLGAEEIQDGKDNNCNGEIDERATIDQIDNDQDGYTLIQDCNDQNPYIHPGAAEVCDDGIDNDCDGKIDCDDEGCAQDSSCKEFFDFSAVFSAIGMYKYFVIGAAIGVIAILFAYLGLRMMRKQPEVREEFAFPELGEEVPSKAPAPSAAEEAPEDLFAEAIEEMPPRGPAPEPAEEIFTPPFPEATEKIPPRPPLEPAEEAPSRTPFPGLEEKPSPGDLFTDVRDIPSETPFKAEEAPEDLFSDVRDIPSETPFKAEEAPKGPDQKIGEDLFGDVRKAEEKEMKGLEDLFSE